MLRQRVLRPRQAQDDLVYPGDESADACHVGAFVDGSLVGVASVTREPQPGGPERDAWRLRGMATLESTRRSGIGAALLDACRSHVAERGGSRLWCNARSSALAFYESQGFRAEGAEFELPEIGPHFLMWRDI